MSVLSLNLKHWQLYNFTSKLSKKYAPSRYDIGAGRKLWLPTSVICIAHIVMMNIKKIIK